MTEARSNPRLLERALRAEDPAGLAAFRILFGTMMLYGVIRFANNGWIDDFFVNPTFHFKYWGFGWVRAWPAWGMYLHFAVLGLAALLVALGLFYRVAIVTFFLAFTYVELIDVTTYLNHYYLVSLLSLLLIFLPANAAWSLDALRKPSLRAEPVRAFDYALLRAQVGIVYFFAGLAKFQTDWLFHAQPLNIWLNARTDFPLIGAWFTEPWVASAMSWGGFLFDTTIPLWLSLRRTRPYAYVVVIGFHCMTRALFPIGMFPFIMVSSALVFFSPSWPRALFSFLARLIPRARALLGRLTHAPHLGAGRPTSRLTLVGLGVASIFIAFQALFPLRHHLYGGNVLWHEQGMRFAWKVMVRAKNGSVTYEVYSPRERRTFHVTPSKYLNMFQEREMSAQPDMVLQLAQHIARDFEKRGHGKVEVRADARASLNGRRSARLIDPTVDLASVRDGLGKQSFILPAPQGAPPELVRPRLALR